MWNVGVAALSIGDEIRETALRACALASDRWGDATRSTLAYDVLVAEGYGAIPPGVDRYVVACQRGDDRAARWIARTHAIDPFVVDAGADARFWPSALLAYDPGPEPKRKRKRRRLDVEPQPIGFPAAYAACCAGDVPKLRRIVESIVAESDAETETDVDVLWYGLGSIPIDGTQRSALAHALARGRIDALDALAELDVVDRDDFVDPDRHWETRPHPLAAAARAGRADAVRWVLERFDRPDDPKAYGTARYPRWIGAAYAEAATHGHRRVLDEIAAVCPDATLDDRSRARLIRAGEATTAAAHFKVRESNPHERGVDAARRAIFERRFDVALAEVENLRMPAVASSIMRRTLEPCGCGCGADFGDPQERLHRTTTALGFWRDAFEIACKRDDLVAANWCLALYERARGGRPIAPPVAARAFVKACHNGRVRVARWLAMRSPFECRVGGCGCTFRDSIEVVACLVAMCDRANPGGGVHAGRWFVERFPEFDYAREVAQHVRGFVAPREFDDATRRWLGEAFGAWVLPVATTASPK